MVPYRYDLPFSEWPTRQGRAATKAYRAAMSAVRDGGDPEASIREFMRTLNDLPGTETGEREDAGDAIFLLASAAAIDADLAQAWFDAERDF